MPRLAPYVTGVAEPLAFQALVDSAIQFCEETGVLRLTTDPVQTLAGQATYDLDLPAGTELSRVLKVWLDGVPVYATADAMIDDPRGFSTQVANPTGAPRAAPVIEAGSITLVPAPGLSGQDLVVRAAMRPTRSARVLSDELFNRWCDGVVSGAIYRLATVPAQPFSDPAQAQRAEGMFWQQVNRARVQANRGQMGGPLSVKQRPFV